MRITKATVFGFGKWTDETFVFPREGPVLIFGENESGKSTFHQFLLFMLFGMPPKKRRFFMPKTSSKLGGQLFVEDDEVGSFTIERFDDKNNGKAICLLPTGEIYDEVWLQERLKGIEEQSYKEIFSFSALDLQAIKEMDQASLSDVLLSIGLTGSSSIYQIEREFDQRLGNLFKPFGKKPAVNQQLQILEGLEGEMNARKDEEATYHKNVMASHKLENKLKNLQDDIRNKEQERTEIKKQESGLSFLKSYEALVEKHEPLKKPRNFPSNGLTRLENIKDNLRPLESERAVLRRNIDQYENRLSEIEKEILPNKQFNELLEKKELQPTYKKISEEIDELKLQEKETSKAISSEITELQLGGKEYVEELSLPFYTEEMWKNLKDEHDRLEQEKSLLQMEKNTLQEKQMHVEYTLQKEKETVLSDDHVAQIREKINQGKEAEQLERLHEATRKQQTTYQKAHQHKRRTSLRLFTLSLLFTLIAAGIGLYTDERLYYALAVLLLIIGVGQWIVTKKNGEEIEKLLQLPLEKEEMERHTKEELATFENQLEVQQKKQEKINRLQEEFNKLYIEELQVEEKERSFHEKKRRLNERIEEQYTFYPFLADIHVAYWPEYYDRLRSLVQLNQTLSETIEKRNRLENRMEQLDEEITSFVHMLQGTIVEESEAGFAVIDEQIEKNKGWHQEANHLKERIKEARDNEQAILKRIEVHQEEMDHLFKLADVQTEEAFYETAAYMEEKEKLEEELGRIKRQLDVIFENSSWKQLIPVRLNKVDLESKKQDMEKKIARIQEDMEDTRSKLADVHAELRRLETSEEHSEKMHQFEMEKEKLHEFAKEWSILKIEKEVLAKTKSRYQAKYLTKVIKETSDFLSFITGGRYEAVYPPEGDKAFSVMDAKGLRYTVDELSEGTMNQLYVALRFSISTIMTEKHHVPFIIDDAFVHFDAVRVRRMIELLMKIAKNQQVIVFTCKSDVYQVSSELEIPIITI
jgi:uncharacterized protein YhaN